MARLIRFTCVACAMLAVALSSAARAADKKPVIGVSVLTLGNPFFKTLSDSLSDEAKKNGMDTIVVSGEFDVAKQKDQVNDFISRKVDAIVLCPCDSKAIGAVIESANKAGIPVFTADIASLADTGKVVSHVATDNAGGGRLAGKAMIEAIGGSGKIAILEQDQAESGLMRRVNFEKEIEDHNAQAGAGKIEIVARLPGGGVKDTSFAATQDLLTSHPDLAGIFAINDPSALGAVAALERAGKLQQVKVIGFDGGPEGKQAIRDGKIYADPVQFPDRIGKQTADSVAKYLAGDDVQAKILIPPELYRQADAQKDAGK